MPQAEKDMGQSVFHEIRRTCSNGREARRFLRTGAYTGPTNGIAPGYVQGNLAILPNEHASDFLKFCQFNPKPCPLIGLSPAPGHTGIPQLGDDLDIRTDLPRYRVWRHGELVDEPSDILSHWRDDLVAFVLGCSFSFEWPLIEDGIELRHITKGINVAMYRTNIDTVPAGPFRGPMVVSMRPLQPAKAIRAVQITSRYPAVHGAPVHIGLPEVIGINDISKPDYGDPVEIHEDELPVFWACGVTPQSVVATIKLPFCITHAPGSMLISDIRNNSLALM